MSPSPYDAVLSNSIRPRPYDVVLGGKVKAIEQATKAAGNGLDKYLIKQGKYLKVTNKAVKASKVATDALKSGDWKGAGTKFGRFMSLAGVALNIFNAILGFANKFAIEQISESNIREFERDGVQFARQYKLIEKAYIQIRDLQANFKKLNDDYKKFRTDQLLINDRIVLNLSKVRKSVNDALYEVRQNRVKLEASIAKVKKSANDALYETRQGRLKVEASIATVRKSANDALYEVRQGRAKLDARVNELNTKFAKLTTDTINTIRRVTTIETRINNIRPTTPNQPNRPTTPNQPNTLPNDVVTRANFPTLIQQQIPTIAKGIEPITAKIVDGKIESIKREFDGKISKKLDGDKLVTEIQLKTGQIVKVLEPSITAITKPIVDTQLKPMGKVVEAHGNAIGNILELFNGHNVRLDKAEYNIDKERIDNDVQAADIEGLKKANRDLIKKLGEQEKVNTEGNKILDDLLKWSLTIPPLLALIPRNTANLINPNIPTLGQIGKTVKDNTPQSNCRFSEAPIYDAANKVNNHSTALDVVQTGLITANTGIVTNINNTANTINNKLGAQLTGGISGKLVNGFKWLHLDRVLSVLTFAATVQNHLMLSRDIGTTLLGAFSNVLSLIGLKDDNGQAFDLGSVINSTIENIVKGIVGAENYATLSETWAKASRIYQATTNVLNSFQQLSSTILSGMELIAGNNSKIGNALKKAGIVLETAYGWMNPQPKFNRVTQVLEKFQAGASTIQQVTQAPLDIINATTELQNANTELIKAVKEDHKPENKAPEIPEPDELKTKQVESKAASQPLIFDFSDLFDGED